MKVSADLVATLALLQPEDRLSFDISELDYVKVVDFYKIAKRSIELYSRNCVCKTDSYKQNYE